MYTLGIPDRQKRRTLGYLKQQFVDFKENPSMEGFFDVSFPGMDEDAFRNIVMKLKQQEAPTLEEMENNPLLNALKRTLQSWSTKRYNTDREKWEEFTLDIEELVQDYEEQQEYDRGFYTESKEDKIRKLIRDTIRK